VARDSRVLPLQTRVSMHTSTITLLGLCGAIAVLSCASCARVASDPGPTTASPPPGASAIPAARLGRLVPADPALDDALVGTAVPEWTTEEWLNTQPLTLHELRGRVVLVRWFMGTSCPMCSASAPSLSALHDQYASKGLTVIGMYHHKEDEPLKAGEYAAFASAYGFHFPVARDPDWTTLKAWWLTGHERDFTSVSFLLDRQGRVRGIHPGGRMAPGEPAYESMRRGIVTLLAER
jgi:peroxiredoxin